MIDSFLVSSPFIFSLYIAKIICCAMAFHFNTRIHRFYASGPDFPSSDPACYKTRMRSTHAHRTTFTITPARSVALNVCAQWSSTKRDLLRCLSLRIVPVLNQLIVPCHTYDGGLQALLTYDHILMSLISCGLWMIFVSRATTISYNACCNAGRISVSNFVTRSKIASD